MKSQFHMVLPSDSSMTYFPENTATHFTTMLPHEIHLNGVWGVALTEIQFPCNLLQIKDEKEARVMFLLQTAPDNVTMDHYAIPRGLYNSIECVIYALNHISLMSDHVLFEINGRGYVTVSLKCRESGCKAFHVLEMASKLKHILGFVDSNVMSLNSRKNQELSVNVGNRPASLVRALPDKMLVYCDICEPYITGDAQTPLLRIVPCDNSQYKYGSTHTAYFSVANYIPLLRTSFRTIEIDIRDTHGDSIPFEYGPLNVTLHFKRME